MKDNKITILTNGFIKENPVLVLVLGTCPTLAVSTQAINGLGMGLSTTVVLIFSNIFISSLKRVIPDKVRIPCYIVVIATFVTIVQLLLKAYFPDLDRALGIYIPLIVVNCIILGRAEMFANKNSVVDSALDGVGMGIGFKLALTAIACERELIGSGGLFGISLTAHLIDPMAIFVLAPGGFFTFGVMIALVNKITRGKVRDKQKQGCAGCAQAAACGQAEEGGCQS